MDNQNPGVAPPDGAFLFLLAQKEEAEKGHTNAWSAVAGSLRRGKLLRPHKNSLRSDSLCG